MKIENASEREKQNHLRLDLTSGAVERRLVHTTSETRSEISVTFGIYKVEVEILVSAVCLPYIEREGK